MTYWSNYWAHEYWPSGYWPDGPEAAGDVRVGIVGQGIMLQAGELFARVPALAAGFNAAELIRLHRRRMPIVIGLEGAACTITTGLLSAHPGVHVALEGVGLQLEAGSVTAIAGESIDELDLIMILLAA